MRVSLIVGTTGERKNEIKKFLGSIATQSHRDIEVVFVLQGDCQIDDVVEPFKSALDMKVVRTEKFGLSRARNIGAKLIDGKIIAFPDDDCFYESDTIEKAVGYLSEGNFDVVVGAIYDPDSLETFLRYPQQCIVMTGRKLWLAPSISIFMKTRTFKKVSGFDEDFGLGGKYESGNETDLLFRILECFPDAQFLIDPTIKVYHKKQKRNSKLFGERRNRAFEMSRGQGALVRKHLKYNLFYWMTKLTNLIFRKAFGLLYYGILRINVNAITYYARSCHGLLVGFVCYRRCRK